MFDKKCGPGIADLWQALMVLLEELLEELQAGTFRLVTGTDMHNMVCPQHALSAFKDVCKKTFTR